MYVIYSRHPVFCIFSRYLLLLISCFVSFLSCWGHTKYHMIPSQPDTSQCSPFLTHDSYLYACSNMREMHTHHSNRSDSHSPLWILSNSSEFHTLADVRGGGEVAMLVQYLVLPLLWPKLKYVGQVLPQSGWQDGAGFCCAQTPPDLAERDLPGSGVKSRRAES